MGQPERLDRQLNPKGRREGGREAGNPDSTNTHPPTVPAPLRNCSIQSTSVAGRTLPLHR